MFSDHDKTSPSIAAVSALLVAYSMLAVQQQKRLCCQFVDVSAARRGCRSDQAVELCFSIEAVRLLDLLNSGVDFLSVDYLLWNEQ